MWFDPFFIIGVPMVFIGIALFVVGYKIGEKKKPFNTKWAGEHAGVASGIKLGALFFYVWILIVLGVMWLLDMIPQT